MAGNVRSLDEARRARDGAKARSLQLSAADLVDDGVSGRAAAAIYVSRAEEALALLSAASDEPSRAALRRIIEAWLLLATDELSTLPALP